MNSLEKFVRLIPYRTRRFSRSILSGKAWQKPTLHEPDQWIDGVPQGLDIRHLDEICCDRFHGSITQAQHYHLSGWKEKGAYRLKIYLSNGDEKQFVYKNALYDFDQIPALCGFPEFPGPPEYEIYQKGQTELSSILPGVYSIEEVVPGKEYRYLLEYLKVKNSYAETPELKFAVIELLPRIHQTLAHFHDRVELNNLIVYDRNFSIALQGYAYDRLQRYRENVPLPELDRLFKDWEKICEVHTQEAYFEIQDPVLIHGDLNFSNVFLQRDDRSVVHLVDWEWAGTGFPHADMAALLKGSSPDLEDLAIRIYARAKPELSLDQHRRLYTWCQLERSINDAAFLAAQLVNSDHEASIDLPRAVRAAVNRILLMYQRLVTLGLQERSNAKS